MDCFYIMFVVFLLPQSWESLFLLFIYVIPETRLMPGIFKHQACIIIIITIICECQGAGIKTPDFREEDENFS